ncbi:hypothetical protein CXB51_010415 [Gossypium anomalum]|uniref:Aspartic peptidase DDI1-type domain-containing protein n=1 Tax=Gossypium anomalum TaxID=47600 RepID=A0A8J5Z7C2_9ROSI|nr:hypothetical protein CXB51_010415 [Gossypium anomalum]
MIDTAAGGTINNKTPEEAYEFVEEMSLNNYQWQVMRTKPTKTAGIYYVDSITILSNQVELLNKKIFGLLGSIQVYLVMSYDSSGGGVHTEYQPFNPIIEEEQVNYMGNNNCRSQNNPYSNTYNAGWRNHPNFSWGGQGNQRPQNLPSFQQPPYQQERKPNLEEMLSKFISVLETHFQNTETALKNQQASIQGLKAQIGQLSKLISKHYKPEPEPRQETVVSKGKGEMPNAMKFLRELLANKQKLDEASHVELNSVCSAILQNKLPKKLKDPGSFAIRCLIGSLDVNNALANLGASINVMPHKMFKQLGLGKPKQTRMSIQLADKTIRFPRGIIEDVLVKIDKFIFPVDFIVLDIEEDNNTPLILGMPFLATAKTIIDVVTGELTLRVGDETITLQARNSGNTSKIEGPIHEERRLQIEEPDEWRTHKLRTHDKLKLRQNELNTSPNKLKVGDKVLLDATDPHIVTAKPNEKIPLTVLSFFPFDTVEVSHPKFGTFKVNNTCLKPYFDEIDSRNEGYKLLEPL